MKQDRHPSDAAFIRLADGELTDADRRALDEHLSACPSCRARFETLSAIDERTKMMLTLAAWNPEDYGPWVLREVPATGLVARGRRWVPAAAIALAASVVLVFQPVRSRLLPGLGDGSAGAGPESGAIPDPVPGVAVGSTQAVIDAVADRLEIRVYNAQSFGGELVIVPVEGVQIRARIEAQSASPAFEWTSREGVIYALPGLVEIINTDSSTASYRIEVPRSLSRVSLKVGATVDSVLWSNGPPVDATELRVALGG